MPAIFGNSALATGVEKVFIPVSKKGNAKECSNYHTIVLIYTLARYYSKFFKQGFNNM